MLFKMLSIYRSGGLIAPIKTTSVQLRMRMANLHPERFARKIQ
jgi:hypothetical protein